MHEQLAALSKKQYATLRGLAYQRELTQALSELETQFQLWRNGDIGVFELEVDIHRFHDGIARELYKAYVMNRGNSRLVEALERGVVSIEEVAGRRNV